MRIRSKDRHRRKREKESERASARAREREMSKKEKCHKRDETGSKSDCLSVFFSFLYTSFFCSNEQIRVSFLCPHSDWLPFFLPFSLSLAAVPSLLRQRRRSSTLLQSSRRSKEENKLTIGWLSFSSFWLLPGLVALICRQRFFFLSFFWRRRRRFLLLPVCVLNIVLPSHVHGDWLLTTNREIMPDYTPIVRQGHWSAVTIPNG